MIDYAENLCEAMKIIFEKQIKQLSFDITIDATVVDATNAKNGMYVVSHDGATFTAYSTDTSFKEKDVVMVTVPQGNYDNQKMIIGKQVDKDKGEKPITYQSPFSQIVNLSGNLVYGDGEKSLLANDGVGKTPSETAKAQRVTIIEDNSLSEEYQTNGYTRLGLRADFSTWLNEFNVVSGNYGLALTLTFKNPDNNNDNIQAIYTFDSSEFFGDIYNFETYYNQEAVFDISDYSDYFLQGIKLEAYQLDNFETSNGKPLSYDNMPFNDISKPTDNIFIKEPFICLGTAVGEFKKDNIKIVTDSSSTYTTAENVKNLKLKWTHQDLNSKDIYVVQEDKIPANYEIRWYKFELGKPSPDEFMDAHWARFYGQNKTQNNDIVTNKINISFSPDPTNQTEQIRAIVLKIDNNNTALVARSPIITFNNDNEVPNKANKIDANALGIQFTDFEKGKYYYYNKVGKIIYSESDKNRKHYLKAVFKNDVDLNNKQDLEEQSYTSIKWILPSTNSMIIPVLPDGKTIDQIEFTSDPSDPNNIFIFNNFSESNLIENNYYKGYEIRKNNHNNTYEILFLDQYLPSGALESALVKLEYKIDEKYSFNKTRNNVFLEVEINNQKYITSTMMFFGLSGTSGSDYTIVVDWGISGQKPPVFNVEKNNELRGSVRLLDIHGETVNLNEKAIYKYKWYQLKKNKDLDGLTIIDNNSENIDIQDASWSSDNIHNSSFILKDVLKNNNSQVTINDLYVLEVKLSNFGDYDLITRYPIALKNVFKNNNMYNGEELIVVNGITGTTTLRYASDGTITPDDENPYSIQFQYWSSNNNGSFQEADDKEVGYWKVIAEDNVNSNFFPELIEVSNEEATIDAFLLELNNLKINKKFTNREILNIIKIFEDSGDMDANEETMAYSYEEFIAKLNNIFHKNVDYLLSQKSLLDILQNITPSVNQNNIELEQPPIDILIQNLKNYWQPLSEEISPMEDNNAFKQYLLTINKKKLNQLFLTLEEKNIGFSSKNFRKINPILSPPNFYIKDTSLYGVQYILNDTLESTFYRNQVLYTQPIYVYQDNYPSATINKWNGKDLILNEDNGIIMANGFSAGRKENNQFFGVMIGDWSRTEAEDDSITKTTGIYGFHEGVMSYAFKDDGTAFIGKDGKGRIEFNGEEGIIQSAGFNLQNQIGSQFNLQNGSLFLFGNKEMTVDQQEKYSLVLNSSSNQIDTIFSVGRNYILNNRLLGTEELKVYKEVIDDTRDIYDNTFSLLQQYNIIYQYSKALKNGQTLRNDLNFNFPEYSFMYFITTKLQEYFTNDKQGLNGSAAFFTTKDFSKIIFDFYNFNDNTSPFSEDLEDKTTYYYKEDSSLVSYDFEEGILIYNDNNNNNNDTDILKFDQVSITGSNTFLQNYFYRIRLLPNDILKYLINEYIYYLSQEYSVSANKEGFLTTINNYYKDFVQFNKYDFARFSGTPKGGSAYSLKITLKIGSSSSTTVYTKSFKQRTEMPSYYDINYITFFPNASIKSIEVYSYNNLITTKYVKKDFYPYQIKYCHSYGFELYTYRKNNTNYYKLNLIDNDLNYTKLPILQNILYKEWNLTNLQSRINDFINSAIPRISYRSNLYINKDNDFIPINNLFYTYSNSSNSNESPLQIFLIKNVDEINKVDELSDLEIETEENLGENIYVDYTYMLPSNYKNDLIYIDRDGGYLTSKNYRPTINLLDANAILRTPIEDQKWGIKDLDENNNNNLSTYGLKGLIIDLTNDRIVLGNNSSIIGYQSDSGGRDTQNDFPSLREFSISTGATYSKTLDNNNLEKIFNNNNFIIAKKYDMNRNPTIIFKIDWDGNTTINGNIIINGNTKITVENKDNNNETPLSNQQIKYKLIDGTYFLCV